MSNANGIITAPVSITDDVAKVLGVGSSDLGILCKSDKINKFAKYKPIRHASLSELSESQFKALSYGLALPEIVTNPRLDALAIQDACTKDWGYNKPTGGDASPYRLTDFIKYDDNAEPFIQTVGDKFFINKSKVDALTLRFDLDVGDSTYNIQSYDLTEVINLREWILCACVFTYDDDVALTPQIASGTVLDEWGEINENTVTLDISGLSPMNIGYEYNIYASLYRVNGSTYEYIPLPYDGNYNKFPMKLSISADPISGGGGIEDPSNDISFAPSFSSEYKLASECVDEEGGTYAMSNTTGELLIKMMLTNTDSSSATFQTKDFTAAQYYATPYETKYATAIFEQQPTSTAGASSSIVVPANGTKTVWVYFADLLYPCKDTSINNTVEININRSVANIYNGALYYFHGSVGWTKR